MNILWPALVFVCLQSLVEVAREEAARREALDRQGIQVRVIDAIPEGHMILSSGSPSSRTMKEPVPVKEKVSVSKIRDELRRLDRDIRQTQERIESCRARLHSARWAIPKTGRVSGSVDTERAQNKLKQEMEQLQKRLERLQQERSVLYDRGRKAGYLPGELTGKGIIP